MTYDDYERHAPGRELFLVLVRAMEAGAFDDLLDEFGTTNRGASGTQGAYARATRARIASLLGIERVEQAAPVGGPDLVWWLGHDLHCTFGPDLEIARRRGR